MNIHYQVPAPIIARTIVLTSEDRRNAMHQVARSLGFSQRAIVRQVHSGTAIQVPPIPDPPPEADAIVCTQPGVLIGVFTADCVPVLLYREDMIGAIHAGWRGFVNGIFEAWMAAAGCRPDTLGAVIGPAICPDCYEVGMDVARHFPRELVQPARPGHAYLDLRAAAHQKLIQAGVRPQAIHVQPTCTSCVPGLHSYRRNRTPLRNLSVIGIREGSARAAE